MGEAKWIKILVGMFDDPKLKIINSMENRDSICYVWVRCIMLAGSCNEDGLLCINNDMPYTYEILAIEFNRPIEDITKAMEVLIKLQMIEKTPEGIFSVKNWARHQNARALEKLKKDNAARVAKWRAKKKAQSAKDKNQIKDELNPNDNDNNQNADENLNDNDNNQYDNDNTNVNDSNQYNYDNPNNNNTNQNGEEHFQNDDEIKSSNGVCNVTCNGSNQNVTAQKKREEMKIKNEDNKEREDDVSDLEETINNLTEYFKSNSNNKKDITISSIKYAVLKHNAEYVKLAIDKSLIAGKGTMTYVNGILKNWVNEGYPSLNEGEYGNGRKVNRENKSDNTNEFSAIKKKKSRTITESEIQHAESELI